VYFIPKKIKQGISKNARKIIKEKKKKKILNSASKGSKNQPSKKKKEISIRSLKDGIKKLKKKGVL
jgi:hypothetical protein